MSAQAVFDALKYRVEVNGYGTRRYYNNAGQLDRIEYAEGCKIWHQNGQCHRTDGPAVEYTNGHKVWFINDVELTEDKYNQVVKHYE